MVLQVVKAIEMGRETFLDHTRVASKRRARPSPSRL
jgi:hypothetical protein